MLQEIDGLHGITFQAFDTRCRVFANVTDECIFDKVKTECVRYDGIFSHTNPASSLSFLNSAQGMPVRVDPELAGLLDQALGYCGWSGGLFDITSGTLEQLWNYHNEEPPTAGAIAEAMKHVGYEMVHVHGNVACIDDPKARVVLGGIAKGYIADKLVELLRTYGATSGAVDLGGNVAVLGVYPSGQHWRIQVADPQHPGHSLGYVLARDEAFVTSGTYERFFTSGGCVYHHIVDPRTGRPAQTDITAAAVLSERATAGDGYTTALVIMGSQEALDFFERTEGIEGFVIRTDGRIQASSGMRQRLVIADPSRL